MSGTPPSPPDDARDDAPADAPAGTPPGPRARAVVEDHRALAAAAQAVLDVMDATTVGVAALVAQDREARVRAELAQVDVDRLGDMTEKNLRLSALAAAGYTSVADLLGKDAAELDAVPGVGAQTARSVVAAVEQLAEAVRAGTHVRIELDDRGRPDSAGTVELLRLLHRAMRLRPLVEPQRSRLTDYAASVRRLLPRASRAASRLRFAFSRPTTRQQSLAALAQLRAWEPWLASTDLRRTVDDLGRATAEPDAPSSALWDDFERRSATYYSELQTIVPSAVNVLAARGMLTSELADRVAEHPLDLSYLRVQLRGYQEFGARFALHQGRALLGDEMGLGKTVQAIAAMTHLAASGERHFLVVCPASVLVNWVREVAEHSALTPHRLHGADRDAAIRAWVTQGGVGVTTFEGLAHLPLPGEDGGLGVDELGMVVVDEAHYVKNPAARRTRAVRAWTDTTWRVLLLTGTPMDNRLEDFVELVRLVQPNVADGFPSHLGLVGGDAFREAVAPVYLRRNQRDVLVELPELVLVDEWEDLSSAGEVAYRAAVASGNFMAMRRAAFLTPDPRDSAKLGRLLEIVEDAGENGHRTVVFSFFRDVIAVVDASLRAAGVPVFGPLTGSVPADERQAIIDAFGVAGPDAVLIAQITAGGVGLNMQAASVAVLCEPQLTPAAEAQAIARLHRMGQVRSVRAHRLLAEDGVDERITEILDGKRRVFDEYVRDSALAASSVHAVDVTEARLAREVVAAEQARLGYGPVWDARGDGAGPTLPDGVDEASAEPVAASEPAPEP
ncbi:SNF2-related protein [Cellulomonas sp.]|uniref:DEAD/DEAH box helicase n=1 Tax=Cellulomonas sp. TaxID=40001 RepID=UPI001AFE102C|nr:SNF2-related protein [Cellulomonas sp.]MBO9553195.1 ATP-dependent helicase [Cellulomonas sp.]